MMYMRWRWRRQDAESKEIYEMVEKIIGNTSHLPVDASYRKFSEIKITLGIWATIIILQNNYGPPLI